MHHLTFSLTIALEDDAGRTYDAGQTIRTLQMFADPLNVDLFTIARGEGHDTETGHTEPVVIVQGIGSPDAVDAYGRHTLRHAQTMMNQRAVGWFTSADSYRTAY